MQDTKTAAQPAPKPQPHPLPSTNLPTPQIKVHDMSQWESKWVERDKAGITDIITHHTVMDANSSPVAIDNAELSMGSLGGGYNFYIPADGTIWVLRKVHFRPAAAYGRNTVSINIALGGDFTKELPNKKQHDSWMWLCAHLLARKVPYGPGQFSDEHFTISNCIGHREVATRYYPDNTDDYSTQCPGNVYFPVLRHEWIPALQKLSNTKVS